MVFYALALIPTMTRLRCSCKYDIIHVHNRYSYILQAHGSLPRIGAWRKLKWFYDALFGYKLLRDASRVIALSRVEAEQYRRMGVPEEKIAIIPNGIDLSEYANLPPKGSFKKKFGIKEEEKIVLYLGRIHWIKGVDILVKAFANVIKKLDNIRLVIVGPDDGYLSELRALIKALRIEKICKEDGFFKYYKKPSREQIFKILKESSLLVHPSEKETFSLAIAESLACNTPFIAYDVPSMREALKRFSGGVLVPYKDRKALSQKICELLNDKDKVEKLARWGRDAVESKFTWEKTAKRVEKAFEVFLTDFGGKTKHKFVWAHRLTNKVGEKFDERY